MTVNIIIDGALGRMGRQIASLAAGDPDFEIKGAVEAPQHSHTGSNYGDLIGAPSVKVPVVDDLSQIDTSRCTIISFTEAGAAAKLLAKCAGMPGKLVLGTTGLDDNSLTKLKELGGNKAVVFSPNMSLGVNLLFYLTEMVAHKLRDTFDIEIIEAHHRHKKDSPSGTARKLGEIVAGQLDSGYDSAVKNGRAGLVGERTDKEIGMHAVRAGDIIGDHTVLFAGTGERLELKHMAHSRATFAQGALKAAQWLENKGPGLYSMRDILQL
ncbi:MAG: 4-hydroxy-tetrahydrodipicolinate reductase [Chitinivibrionales bacterium]|nr:4-hydroxy-tetrahydrodipicolinate reductase [Chitinivibrionales bacterium]